MDEDEICSVVKRLSRPNRAGDGVIERAAIMAEGPDSADILAWITAHGGAPEAPMAVSSKGGLHSARLSDTGGIGASAPRRYVVPAASLPG